MKSLLKFITCGSVDDGKSTLIGHILYDSKLLYTDQEKALELDSKVGSRDGHIDYSLLLDGLIAEREQGITIDVAYRYFTTQNRSFIVADTPGHEEYTRNMAVGASFAQLSIILLNAKTGVLVQTRRHARICSLMGIKHFVFAINKMDLVNYDEERFIEISKSIEELAKSLGISGYTIVPISATEGDNLTKKSENTPWYIGETLLSHLENIDVIDDDEDGFYIPIQRVCRPNHTFRGFQGQIESGSISVGDKIIVLPKKEEATVKSIHYLEKEVQSAIKGQPVTIQLDREVDVSRGSVISKDINLKSSRKIIANILWMDDTTLEVGKEYFVKLGTKLTVGTVTRLEYKIDVNSGEHINISKLLKNELAHCEIYLADELAVDEFKNHKTLGELILIDRVSNMTSACGVVNEVLVSDKNSKNIIFKHENLEIEGDLFDEFYYNMENFSLQNYREERIVYKVGDEIPVEGKTYSYPNDFDIIVFRNKAVVEVRGKKIKNIIELSDYSYNNLPVVNGRGFALNISSKEQFETFINEFHSENER
jgi:sulfate adenylyltransferase subunit 1